MICHDDCKEMLIGLAYKREGAYDIYHSFGEPQIVQDLLDPLQDGEVKL